MELGLSPWCGWWLDTSTLSSCHLEYKIFYKFKDKPTNQYF